ncbi:hypothetical protein ANCDUO_20580, partial [Ancylostoma duodenale]
TGELSANEALRESSYSFTVTVTDGANHDDSASVVISVVTYSQQTELLFDAPFEFIVRNERNIVRLLSNATSLTAVVDRCRQNLNFTVVLAHFLDSDGAFVEVDTALRRMMSSNTTARRELTECLWSPRAAITRYQQYCGAGDNYRTHNHDRSDKISTLLWRDDNIDHEYYCSSVSSSQWSSC